MKTKHTDIIMQDKIFAWIAIGTAFLLTLPYLAMEFNWQVPDPGSSVSDGVNWTLGDFVVAGALLFGAGSIFVLLARKVSKKNRLAVGLTVLVALLVIWVHLAVGIVDTWPLAGS